MTDWLWLFLQELYEWAHARNFPQDLVNHVALHSIEGGNIDCLHPAQSVVDAMCGENRDGYAHQLEDWFEI